jgi:diguanylate cyclase (GGDEF)-like protein
VDASTPPPSSAGRPPEAALPPPGDILQAARVALVVIDARAVIRWVNPAFLDLVHHCPTTGPAPHPSTTGIDPVALPRPGPVTEATDAEEPGHGTGVGVGEHDAPDPPLRPAALGPAAVLGSTLGAVQPVVGLPVWQLLPPEIGLTALTCLPPTGVAVARPLAGVRRVLRVPEQDWPDRRGRPRRVAWTLSLIPDVNDLATPGWVLATGVDITRERSQEATWRHRAYTDPLTGAANRAGALAALRKALDPFAGNGFEPVSCAVMLCDLDAFKPVNDRYGHATGDQVLCRVADRLTGLVRADDVVARLGGDEFLLIKPDIHPDEAHTRHRMIQTALTDPFPVTTGAHHHHHDDHDDHDGGDEGGEGDEGDQGRRAAGHDTPITRLLPVGISVGLRVATTGEDAAAVLHDADLAMYADKQRRKRLHGAGKRRPG